MRKNCKRSGGFTLLELVVALTILTLITVLIGQFFYLALNAWEKGEAETVLTQRLRVLSGLLSQEIKSAYPYKMEIDDEKVVVFKGEADSIMFVTTIADFSYGGFKWIRYSFKDGTLFQKQGLLPDKELPDKISGDEEIVDSDMEEIGFEYYSVDDGEWKDSWDYGEYLPGAVRVQLSGSQLFRVNIPMGPEEKQDEN